jgi:molecular chaperone DnaK (HSP70)
MVEERVGHEVKKAVITGPVYFSEAQRQTTLEAAKSAQLEVLWLLPEPAAAAIACWYERPPSSLKTVIGFDFGLGPLDVSLMTIEHKEIRILAVASDTYLGDRDFEVKLIAHCHRQFDPDVRLSDLEPDVRCDLQTRVQEAKISLSESTVAQVFVRGFRNGKAMNVNIRRDAFENFAMICLIIFLVLLVMSCTMLRKAWKTSMICSWLVAHRKFRRLKCCFLSFSLIAARFLPGLTHCRQWQKVQHG